LTPEAVTQLGKDTIYTILLVASPMLGAGLLIGLVVSLLQAVTQVHEMTLTFIPKILGVAVATLIFLPWMLQVILAFTARMIMQMPNLVK